MFTATFRREASKWAEYMYKQCFRSKVWLTKEEYERKQRGGRDGGRGGETFKMLYLNLRRLRSDRRQTEEPFSCIYKFQSAH